MSPNFPPHPTSHQTVRLDRGRHATPDDGACVMELASMLAGERFTDHPRSVCRVIAALLRAYNDQVDPRRRQDLYGCAAIVVDSRGSRRTERARYARCERELAELHGRSPRHWRSRIRNAGLAVSPFAYHVARLDDLARALTLSADGQRRMHRLVGELVEVRIPELPWTDVAAGAPDPPVPAGMPRVIG